MQQVEDAGKVILKVLTGSRAYGLDTSESDYDYKGVFVVPTHKFLTLDIKPRETAWIEGQDEDNIAWEIHKFFVLATQCNPTALETMVAPIEYSDEEGITLRTLMPYCLSRKRVYDAYSGYAHNQRRKMFEPTGTKMGTERLAKFAINYLRSLWQGIELLCRGTYNPRIANEELKAFLIELRASPNVDLLMGTAIDKAVQLEKELGYALQSSMLPHEPEMDAINEFILKVRKNNW